jgi:hypothetical protein
MCGGSPRIITYPDIYFLISIKREIAQTLFFYFSIYDREYDERVELRDFDGGRLGGK